MGPEECEDCCAIVCCSTFGYICCCRKMEKNTKIKILWAWLIVLATVSGVILYCGLYPPFSRLASPSDMIAIQDHANFLFCEELKVKSPGLQFNGYIVSGDLKVDNRATKRTHQSTAMFVSSKSFDYLAFYFLRGSHLTLHHCSKQFLTLYVLISDTNFQNWKSFHNCVDCYFSKATIPAKLNCDGDDQYSTFDLNIITDEEYYIAYSNDNFEDTWVDLKIEMDRKVYDLDNATSVCTETTECDLFLTAPKQTPLIWVMDYDNMGQHNHQSVAAECVPRMWAFLLIHGFPVLLVGILATALIQRCHRTSSQYNRVTERTPLLVNATLPPSYSTVMRDPPKYEDISRTCDPPPYTQVVAAIQSSPAHVVPEFITNNQILPYTLTSTEQNYYITTPDTDIAEQNSQNDYEANGIDSCLIIENDNVTCTNNDSPSDRTSRRGSGISHTAPQICPSPCTVEHAAAEIQ